MDNMELYRYTCRNSNGYISVASVGFQGYFPCVACLQGNTDMAKTMDYNDPAGMAEILKVNDMYDMVVWNNELIVLIRISCY